MEAFLGAGATIVVALIGLVGVRLETTRREIKTTGETTRAEITAVSQTNVDEHETTMLLLRSMSRDIGGLRSDVRDLTKRFNDHVDKD